MPTNRTKRAKTPPPAQALRQKRQAEPETETETDEDRSTGSHFLPDVAWSLTKRLELWRVVFDAKSARPRFTDTGIRLERWDDSESVRERAGGSGDGTFQVRAIGKGNAVLGSHTWAIDGEPRVANAAANLQTAFETSMGVVTVPGVAPMTNLIFALLQQQTAQVRGDTLQFMGIMERMFTAVCVRDAAVTANGGNGQAELQTAMLKMFMGDSEKQRSRVTELLEHNAKLSREGKTRTSTKEVIGGVVSDVIQNSDKIINAIGRAVRGELTDGEVAKIAAEAQGAVQQTAEAAEAAVVE